VTRSEILARLQEVFDDVFLDPVVIAPELTARNVPEWDSLMHVSLVVAVERKFNVKFRLGEVEATKNVGEFADLIGRRQEAR
jgi:acyl carrier protein